MSVPPDLKAMLKQLNDDPGFSILRDEILIKDVPEIMPWRPTDVTSGKEDTWKYESGLKEGYLLALRKLGIKL